MYAQAAADAASTFDWSGIWQVVAAAVTGVIALLALRKSTKSNKVASTLDARRFEADEHERALANAISECDRCRKALAEEREMGGAALREAEEKLNRALARENEAWILVGTYREKERLWLIERADLLREVERGRTQ